MITESDLRQAIAECHGERHPNATTCMKLAAYYTIQDHLGTPDIPTLSFAAAPAPSDGISLQSNTEFSRAVSGKKTDSVLAVVDDLMQALRVLSPRLYRLTMEKIENA